MATEIPDVLDRLYAIHQTLDNVTAMRYHASDTSRVPLITAYPGNAQHSGEAYGTENIFTSRNYVVLLLVRNFVSGVVDTTAQRETEQLIDDVLVAYWQRPRLEIAVEQPNGATTYEPLPDIMADARLTQDSGIIAERDNIASVRFTLTVETNRTIRRLGNA